MAVKTKLELKSPLESTANSPHLGTKHLAVNAKKTSIIDPNASRMYLTIAAPKRGTFQFVAVSGTRKLHFFLLLNFSPSLSDGKEFQGEFHVHHLSGLAPAATGFTFQKRNRNISSP